MLFICGFQVQLIIVQMLNLAQNLHWLFQEDRFKALKWDPGPGAYEVVLHIFM